MGDLDSMAAADKPSQNERPKKNEGKLRRASNPKNKKKLKGLTAIEEPSDIISDHEISESDGETSSNIEGNVTQDEQIPFNRTSDSSEDEEPQPKKKKKPAWIDDGDVLTCQEAVESQGKKINFGKKAGDDYKHSLEDKFNTLVGSPKWAKKRVKSDSDNYLNKTGSFVKKTSALQKGIIEIQKLKDLNRQTYSEGMKVTSVLFHPTSTVGLVSGISGVVSLFQVDGKENTKLQSIQYKNYPVHSVAFLKNGEQFIIGSSYHHYFYTHDLISGHSSQVSNIRTTDITNTKRFKVSPDGKFIILKGKFGNLYVLSAITKELITTLKMNGNVGAFDFIGTDLYAFGSEGQVYIWDMNTRSCVHKFTDEGCLIGTAMAATPNGSLLACGANTGVINIYDVNTLKTSSSPTPLKTVLNMVTSINALRFNATSEILAMSSHEKDNAVKLLHCPSMSIFSNFPLRQAELHRVQCLDFSPNSGFFAFGNNHKTMHLYRLKYYGNY